MSKTNLKKRINSYYKYLYTNSSEYSQKLSERNKKIGELVKKYEDTENPLKKAEKQAIIEEIKSIRAEQIKVENIDAPNKDFVIKQVQRLEKRLTEVC